MQETGLDNFKLSRGNTNVTESSVTFHPREEECGDQVHGTCTGTPSRLFRRIWRSMTNHFRKAPPCSNSRLLSSRPVNSTVTSNVHTTAAHDSQKYCDLQPKHSANTIPTLSHVGNSVPHSHNHLDMCPIMEVRNSPMRNNFDCPVSPPNANRPVLKVVGVVGEETKCNSAGDKCSVDQNRPALLKQMSDPNCKRFGRTRLVSLSGPDRARHSSTFSPSELRSSEELRFENRRMLKDLQSVKLVLLKLRRLLTEDQWMSDRAVESWGSSFLQDQPDPPSNDTSVTHLAPTPNVHSLLSHATTGAEHSVSRPTLQLTVNTAESCQSSPGVWLCSPTETSQGRPQYQLNPDQMVMFANLTKNLALVQLENQDLDVP